MNQTSESRVRFLGTFLDSGIDERVDRDQAYVTSFEPASCELNESQISRGSNASTASIVNTTTAAKKIRPVQVPPTSAAEAESTPR